MANGPRKLTAEFKSQVVLELLARQRTAGGICRGHQIKDSLLYGWKQEFLERAPSVFALGEHGELSRLAQRNGQLPMQAGSVGDLLRGRSDGPGPRRMASPFRGAPGLLVVTR